jgi:hypothetical protein
MATVDPKIVSFRIPDPDPESFHPGSYIRGMKNKTVYLAPYGFRSKP